MARQCEGVEGLAEWVRAAHESARGHGASGVGGALVVGMSGIDGSGKGWVSERAAARLNGVGVRTGVVHLDAWLNPPGERELRLADGRPAPGAGAHFLEHAFDFERVLARVVRPVRQAGGVELRERLAGQSGKAEELEIRFEGIEVLIVEGVFLLQAGLGDEFDATVWLDCSFATALERALERGQEGLGREEMVRDYLGMYFPAQLAHFERDQPRGRADVIVRNDGTQRAAAERGSGLEECARIGGVR